MKYCVRVKMEVFKEYAVEADSEGAAEVAFNNLMFENEDPGRTVHSTVLAAEVVEAEGLKWDDEWWKA
jgi:hypothetical protein